MIVATLSAVVLSLSTAAIGIRRMIEPACPQCSARDWEHLPSRLTCCGCGWAAQPSSPIAAGRPLA